MDSVTKGLMGQCPRIFGLEPPLDTITPAAYERHYLISSSSTCSEAKQILEDFSEVAVHDAVDEWINCRL